MLAVKEVNGCLFFSYAHTKMALDAGMSPEEIQNMLTGVSDDIPEEEISAVFFHSTTLKLEDTPLKNHGNGL